MQNNQIFPKELYFNDKIKSYLKILSRSAIKIIKTL